MDVKLPSGLIVKNVPDGISQSELMSIAIKNGLATSSDFETKKAPTSPEADVVEDTSAVTGRAKERKGPTFSAGQGAINIGAGLLRGAGSIGATALRLFETEEENIARRKAISEGLRNLVGADPESGLFGLGKIAGEVAGTAGLAPVLGAGAAALPVVRALAPAISSSGFVTKVPSGLPAAPATILSRGVDLTKRLSGGAIAGGATAAAIEPTVEDIEIGTAIGAAIPGVAAPVVKGLAKGTGWLYDAISGKLGEVKAAKIARAVADGEINAIKAANLAASQGETAGQAAAGIDNSAWQALDELTKSADTSSWWSKRFLVQKAENTDTLNRLAGGATPTESRAVQESTKKALNKITTPMREQAFEQTLPINSKDVLNRLTSKLVDFDISTNRDAVGSIRYIENLIAKQTDESGNIAADALYAIRKNGVTSAIKELNPGASDNAQKRLAQTVLSSIKPIIDDAIVYAGGKKFPNYLETFEKGMKAIEQKEMADYARNLYVNGDKKGFVDLVKGSNPSAVEDIFGPGRYDFIKEMGGKSIRVEEIFDASGNLNKKIKKQSPSPALEFLKLAEKVEKELKMEFLANNGRKSLQDIFVENQSNLLGIPIPSLLNAKVTLIRENVKLFEGKVNKETYKALVRGMQSGESANKLLATLPTSERNKVLNILTTSEAWNPAVQKALPAAAISYAEE